MDDKLIDDFDVDFIKGNLHLKKLIQSNFLFHV